MGADHRTYIKVHDGLPQHPKIEGLSDRAFRLLIETWCYCSQYLTDGVITEQAWKRRGTAKARAELQSVGLVTQSERGFVEVHDYSEHQRTREEVAEFLAKKRDAGAFGNHRRWHVAAGQSVEGCQFCEKDASQMRSQSDRMGSSQTIARDRDRDRDRDREVHKNTPPASPGPPKVDRGTRLPDDFEITPELRGWASKEAPNAGPRDHDAFVDYWQSVPGAKGVKKNWDATWRNWMRKASDEKPRARPTGGRGEMPMERIAQIADLGARLQAQADANNRPQLGA